MLVCTPCLLINVTPLLKYIILLTLAPVLVLPHSSLACLLELSLIELALICGIPQRRSPLEVSGGEPAVARCALH